MTLKEEIEAKCTPEMIAEGNYHTIAATVNAGRTRHVLIEIEDVQAYLQTTGAWWTITAVANVEGHPVRQAAQAIIDVANARYKNIDTSLPIVGSMLSALRDASVITPVQYTHITTMGLRDDHVTWKQCNDAMEGI